MLLHGKLRRRGEFWVTEHEPLGDGAPVHTVGLVPVHPATEGITRGDAARAGVGGLPADARRGRAAARAPAGRGAPAGPAGRAGRRRTSRTARRTSAARAGGSRSRSSSCSSSPWPAGAGRGARAAARGRSMPRGVVVDRWRWSLPFELTGDQVRAMGEIDEDLAEDRPMQRLLMGEVGHGQDRRRAPGHAAGGRERRPGRAHGAHRDARRAAPPHARLGCSAAPCRSSCSPAPPARRAGASCSARLATGELQLVVGTHALIEDAGRVPRPGGGRGGRAAPLRRAPARRARRARRPRGSRRTRCT